MFFQVSKLGHYSEEIRRSLSEILLSVMNILLQKYKNIQSNNKRNVADQESFLLIVVLTIVNDSNGGSGPYRLGSWDKLTNIRF